MTFSHVQEGYLTFLVGEVVNSFCIEDNDQNVCLNTKIVTNILTSQHYTNFPHMEMLEMSEMLQ